MLVVKVEIWPGGRWYHARKIGELRLTNTTPDRKLTGNYHAQCHEFDDDRGFLKKEFSVDDHIRSQGAWHLIRKALQVMLGE